MTSRSNERWCSDALEFTCWNGEIVRVAFALDSHDREVISWVATTAGISGEMIRDMMVHCVEQRFGDIRAPRKVQWLSDNGSIFAAYRTLEIAAALNLQPCFTPVESPESNGMAEAFVKTFKRDYVRVNLIPDARAALLRIDHWMEDYNSEHPHSRLGYRSPREYRSTAGVHCITQTSRVSGLTGATPLATIPKRRSPTGGARWSDPRQKSGWRWAALLMAMWLAALVTNVRRVMNPDEAESGHRAASWG